MWEKYKPSHEHAMGGRKEEVERSSKCSCAVNHGDGIEVGIMRELCVDYNV